MNTTRIIAIAGLLLGTIAIALVSVQDASSLEKVVTVLLPLMGLTLGLLISEEVHDSEKKR